MINKKSEDGNILSSLFKAIISILNGILIILINAVNFIIRFPLGLTFAMLMLIPVYLHDLGSDDGTGPGERWFMETLHWIWMGE